MTDDERLQLAEWAYQGEVVGEALFGTMAEREVSPQRREWLDNLRELELRVAGLLRRVVADLGGDATPAAASRSLGERMAGQSIAAGWDGFLKSFEPVTASALLKYRRLLELVETRHRSDVEVVIAHEEALAEFARLAETQHGSPIDPVRRLLSNEALSSST
jgi:hypothetical protein